MGWVIASGNRHKVQEFQEILSKLGAVLLTPTQMGRSLDVDETATTFQGNAWLKALAWCQATGRPAIADDSGLEVDVLDGAPGVWSARFSGDGATDASNNARLVQELQRCGVTSSPARYRCAIVLVEPGLSKWANRWESAETPADGAWPAPIRRALPHLGVTVTCTEGTLEGEVVLTPAGEGGFGYDPYFRMPDGRALAEWTADEKHAVSHRGQALRSLVELMMQVGPTLGRDGGD
jgi:XTP/dITP diphosphohydrolase